MALHIFEILKRPLITEKTTVMQDGLGKYGFEVDIRANKVQVKSAIETSFGVTVTDVNIQKVKGKNKRYGTRFTRRPSWKKAIVTLQTGDKIQIFEGA
ncbi:MAG: 50S ribosomal protein L23 [SAR202 cluster bacterium]|nr:50S ribosomal protein L23 [SAR202 cluster bacterium]|tara:strand:+ start:8344 stop:8637 length:294 start_codon:yes stop_codon:yes gene_type:complete